MFREYVDGEIYFTEEERVQMGQVVSVFKKSRRIFTALRLFFLLNHYIKNVLFYTGNQKEMTYENTIKKENISHGFGRSFATQSKRTSVSIR